MIECFAQNVKVRFLSLPVKQTRYPTKTYHQLTHPEHCGIPDERRVTPKVRQIAPMYARPSGAPSSVHKHFGFYTESGCITTFCFFPQNNEFK